MALINCPECGGKVSDKANACPHCGCSSEYFFSVSEAINPEPTPEQTYLFKLGPYDLTFPTSYEKYINVRRPYEKYASESKCIVKKFYDNTEDIGVILERVSEEVSKGLQSVVDHGMKHLYDNGVYITPEYFLSKYFNNPSYRLNYDNAISDVISQYADITNEKKELEEYRALQKASRGRWEGGGFGLSGAVKGAITAGMLNAGADFLHSFGDSRRKNADNEYIKKKLSDLRESSFAQEKIIDSVYFSLISVFDAIMNELIEAGKEKPLFSEADYYKAKNICDTAEKYESDENCKTQKYLESLQAYPYYHQAYKLLFNKIKKSKHEIGFLGSLFTLGIDLNLDGITVFEYIELHDKIISNKEYRSLNSLDYEKTDVDTFINVLNVKKELYKTFDKNKIKKIYIYKELENYINKVRLHNKDIINQIFNIGESYYNNNNVKKAMYYYLAAADFYDSDSMYKLGKCFEILNDKPTARLWFESAAKRDHAEALIAIGDIYRDKEREDWNFFEAMKYYKKAAELNNGKAYGRIGGLYQFWDALHIDMNLALENYLIASKLGHHVSSYNAAVIYEKNKELKNYSESVKLYELAINQCDEPQERCKYKNKLAMFYESGAGVPMDYNKAEELYLSAIEDCDKEVYRNNLDSLRKERAAKEKFKCKFCNSYNTVEVTQGFFKKIVPNKRNCLTCGRQFDINDKTQVQISKANNSADQYKTDGFSGYSVVITAVGVSKMDVIKAVKNYSHCDLREANDLLNTIPAVVARYEDKEKAENFKKYLELIGATVSIE